MSEHLVSLAVQIVRLANWLERNDSTVRWNKWTVRRTTTP